MKASFLSSGVWVKIANVFDRKDNMFVTRLKMSQLRAVFVAVWVGAMIFFINQSLGQTYVLTDLGDTVGTNSYAQGINNQGQVVGYWTAADGMHAFL